MSFTSFLFGVFLLLVLFFLVQKILNSKTVRISLIAYREHMQQKEIEKEMQKTRQRSIDELRNPDRVLETIMKIKRGEQVTIPIAAFDYIYRNMKKFSIVDKNGRITIINQEDYFRFKQEALALMEQSKNEIINAKEILANIDKTVAENPIEIMKYDDGTMVKIDHVSRTAEVTKPNGEMIFIDHKTETMVSHNLVENIEQKSTKKDIEKDAQIKHKTEENLLLKGKIKKIQAHKKDFNEENAQPPLFDIEKLNQNSLDTDMVGHKEEDKPMEEFICMENSVSHVALREEQKESNTKPEPVLHVNQKYEKVPNVVIPKKKIDVFTNEGKSVKQKIEMQTKPQDATLDVLPSSAVSIQLFTYENLNLFLSQAITYQSLPKILKQCILKNQEQGEVYKISNILKTLIDVNSATETTTSKINNVNRTHECVVNTVDNGASSNNVVSAFLKPSLSVVYDSKISCFLINIHWFFLSLCKLIEEKDRVAFYKDFYIEPHKAFVNNTLLLAISENLDTKDRNTWTL